MKVILNLGEEDCTGCPFRSIDWNLGDPQGYLCNNPAFAEIVSVDKGRRPECVDASAQLTRLIQELMLASRRREGEMAPLDFMPVVEAYAAEEISGGRLRELLLLWSRGASREELVGLLPAAEETGHTQ